MTDTYTDEEQFEAAPSLEDDLVPFREEMPSSGITPLWQGARWQQGVEYYDAEFRHLPELSKRGIDAATVKLMNSRGQVQLDPNKYAKIPENFDFLAYLNGEVSTPWFVVRASILAHYGVQPGNKPDAINLLCEEMKLIENDEGKFERAE